MWTEAGVRSLTRPARAASRIASPGDSLSTKSPRTASDGAVEAVLTSTMPLALAYGMAACSASSPRGPTYMPGPVPLACAARNTASAVRASTTPPYSVMLIGGPNRPAPRSDAARRAAPAAPSRGASPITPIRSTGCDACTTTSLVRDSDPVRPGSGRASSTTSSPDAALISAPFAARAPAPAYSKSGE